MDHTIDMTGWTALSFIFLARSDIISLPTCLLQYTLLATYLVFSYFVIGPENIRHGATWLSEAIMEEAQTAVRWLSTATLTELLCAVLFVVNFAIAVGMAVLAFSVCCYSVMAGVVSWSDGSWLLENKTTHALRAVLMLLILLLLLLLDSLVSRYA